MNGYTAIAIDGPSGAGKSTIARAAAKKFGYLYVDTGAIYRTVGLAANRAGVDRKDGDAVCALLPGLKIEMRYNAAGEQRMFLNGEDVSERIRLPEISIAASDVSALPGVRAFLLDMQLAMDALLGACAKGDIGKLFPDTDGAYLGADSLALLREVCRLLYDDGYSVENIDCTVVAQRPKIAPYTGEMRARLAAAMRGTEAALDALTAGNIRAVADLSNYSDTTGTVMPTAKIAVDGVSGVGAIGSYKVTVTLSKG